MHEIRHALTESLCRQVNGGSPAEKAGLQAGDAVLRINNVDATALRHKDAQDVIVRAGNSFELAIQRQVSRAHAMVGLSLHAIAGSSRYRHARTTRFARFARLATIGVRAGWPTASIRSHRLSPQPHPCTMQHGLLDSPQSG